MSMLDRAELPPTSRRTASPRGTGTAATGGPPPAVLDLRDRPHGVRPGVGFATALATHGEAVAVRCPDRGALTYAALAERVAEATTALGSPRRLVLVRAANDLDTLVGYLGALAGGHPALVVPPAAFDDLARRYDPDAVVASSGDGDPVRCLRRGSAHDLHPDLALVLSTSGSTGAAKAVRLSRRNVEANAASIAEYLAIGPSDLAATTLPMAYCYGLSVLHSHLLAGAGVLLGDDSVADPAFWERFAEAGATSFAGVPHTFSLLERVGFASMALPHLRCVTQAGGRLAPDRVRRLARLGRERGWRFVVMYGQTEATARMAYLPPELAETHPDAIGVPIPGGSFRIDPVEGCAPGEGELVYRGPNVMLGYAEGPADLAAGATLEELRTGDLARRAEDGTYRITGRRSRFVKPYGLRVDLDRAEALLAEVGVEACCTGDDDHLAVGVVLPDDEVAADHEVAAGHGTGARPSTADAAARWLAGRLGLPPGAVRAVAFAELPRLANGKPDQRAVAATVRDGHRGDDAAPVRPTAATTGVVEELATVYGRLLGRDDVGPTDTFVSLGGDSLTYVEASIRVEALLGHLPAGWHDLTVDELAAIPRRHRRGLRTMETGVVLRAVAIVAVVLAHLELVPAWGGAHLLLAVAGYNVARFQITGRGDTVASLRSALARVAVPTVAWVGLQLLVDDRHRWANLLLVENHLADGTWRYWYWFVEVLVQVLVVLAIAWSWGPVRRLERRAPFGFAAGALLATAALSTVAIGNPENDLYRTHAVAWIFVLGWFVQRADTAWRRLLVSATAVVATPLLFGGGPRGAVLVAGLLVLTWAPRLGVPGVLHPVLARLAAASLAIYLTHWMVLDRLWGHASPELTAVVALAVGLVAERVLTSVARAHAGLRSRAVGAGVPVGP